MAYNSSPSNSDKKLNTSIENNIPSFCTVVSPPVSISPSSGNGIPNNNHDQISYNSVTISPSSMQDKKSPKSAVPVSSPSMSIIEGPLGGAGYKGPHGVQGAKLRHRTQEWPSVPDVGKIEEKNPELLAMKILETGRQIEAGRIPVLPAGVFFFQLFHFVIRE